MSTVALTVSSSLSCCQSPVLSRHQRKRNSEAWGTDIKKERGWGGCREKSPCYPSHDRSLLLRLSCEAGRDCSKQEKVATLLGSSGMRKERRSAHNCIIVCSRSPDFFLFFWNCLNFTLKSTHESPGIGTRGTGMRSLEPELVMLPQLWSSIPTKVHSGS